VILLAQSFNMLPPFNGSGTKINRFLIFNTAYFTLRGFNVRDFAFKQNERKAYERENFFVQVIKC